MELYPPRAHQGINTLQFNKPEEALNEEVKSKVLSREVFISQNHIPANPL